MRERQLGLRSGEAWGGRRARPQLEVLEDRTLPDATPFNILTVVNFQTAGQLQREQAVTQGVLNSLQNDQQALAGAPGAGTAAAVLGDLQALQAHVGNIQLLNNVFQQVENVFLKSFQSNLGNGSLTGADLAAIVQDVNLLSIAQNLANQAALEGATAAAALLQKPSSVLPLHIPGVTLQNGQLMATGFAGHSPFQSPISMTASPSADPSCPILHLMLGPIHLNPMALTLVD